MILDVARVVNVSFGVIVGICLVAGLVAGLFAGSVETEAPEVDVPDWHED
jgi:hypothetical protein